MSMRQLGGSALATALVIVLASGCAQKPEIAKQKYLESGNRWFASQKYAEATVEYSNALHIDPSFGLARYKLAEAYRALGNNRAAFPEYIRAADLLPNDNDVQLKAGLLLVNGGFFNEAKERARGVLRREPQNVTALLLLGNALAGLKEVDEASGVLNRAVQVDPERAGVYANLAVFQLAKGENELAEKAFVKATTVSPKSVEAHLNLGNFYRALRRWPAAEASLKTALELATRNTKTLDSLASLYMESGRAELAEPYLKTIVEINNDLRSQFALSGYYVQLGRFPDALKTLETLAKQKGNYAAANIRIGLLHYAAGNRAKAHQIIGEVLKREPRNAGALTVNARLLLAEKKVPEALEQIKTAIQIDPRSPDAQLTLARVQMLLNDVEAARLAFNETLKLDPHALGAQLELSELHRNRNEIDTAVQFAEQAIATDPSNLAARLTLVRALLVRDQDHERAEQELKTLLARHPTSARAQGVVAQLLLSRNDLANSQKAFERELQLDANSVEAVSGLVAIDLSRKRTAEARTRVDAFLAKRPNDPSALVLAAKVYKELGQGTRVEEYLNRALAADNSNPSTYGLLAEHYISQKRLGDAKKQFQQIVKLKPRSVPAITMLGLLCYAERNMDEAQQWWERAMQIDSHAAAAANNLAWLYAEGRGNVEVALQLAMTAKSKYPNLPEVNDTLGWVYYRKELYGQATLYLQQSLDLEPNNPLYNFHLGMAYARKGEDAKARRLLEKALRIDPQFPDAQTARKTLASLVY